MLFILVFYTVKIHIKGMALFNLPLLSKFKS